MSLAENVAMIGKTTYKAGDIWVFRITQNVSKATVESYATSLKASVAAMFPDQTPPQLMVRPLRQEEARRHLWPRLRAAG